MSCEVFKYQIIDPKSIERFIYAGNATFTIVSNKTSKRFTYRVTKMHNMNDTSSVRFVKMLTGPDNETNYTYLGYLLTDHKGMMYAGKKGSPNLVGFKAIDWLVGNIHLGRNPEQLEFYHANKCGACGRLLTAPESIETGLGPICANKHHV